MTELIAEIGINHLGDCDKLYNMISSLHSEGIASIKLQYRSSSEFFDQSLEMGSTLISQELQSVNMSLKDILAAADYAKQLGLKVGVSFFREQDVIDYCKYSKPDFFKIPSAEALNFQLIKRCKEFKKPVMISTGGLSYPELRMLSNRANLDSDDCVFYCVANYPVADGASYPQYISDYKNIFECKIGYSSHDSRWEIIVAFLAQGIDFLERHYCETKTDQGLDISTSSDLREFSKIHALCGLDLWGKQLDIKNKKPNQGEIQAIKDLGSGYYFAKDYQIGELVDINDLIIRSPCRGFKAGSLDKNLKLYQSASFGDPLTMSHIKPPIQKMDFASGRANQLQLSLPVRLHDFEKVDNIFNLRNYEWHLSYQEIDEALRMIREDFQDRLKGKSFSIHLPDYVSSRSLIDPFSKDDGVKDASDYVIRRAVELAVELQKFTSDEVPVVGSFSVINNSKDEFYSGYSDIFKKIHETSSIKILPQFLPRKAWYFGGAVELDAFCSITDLQYIKDLPFGICLDTAHCIMAANSEEQDFFDWMVKLLPYSHHMHVSDAIGTDGEGVPFGEGELGSFLFDLLDCRVVKVVEQWEGHLNNCEGFRDALQFLVDFKK